jgi:hypothetical protein
MAIFWAAPHPWFINTLISIIWEKVWKLIFFISIPEYSYNEKVWGNGCRKSSFSVALGSEWAFSH